MAFCSRCRKALEFPYVHCMQDYIPETLKSSYSSKSVKVDPGCRHYKVCYKTCKDSSNHDKHYCNDEMDNHIMVIFYAKEDWEDFLIMARAIASASEKDKEMFKTKYYPAFLESLQKRACKTF